MMSKGSPLELSITANLYEGAIRWRQGKLKTWQISVSFNSRSQNLFLTYMALHPRKKIQFGIDE